MASGEQQLPARSAAKRGDILHAAFNLFAHRGYEHTSVKDLAAEARVSTATIYAHFENKEIILDGVIDARLELLVNGMLRAVEPITDPLDRLLAGIRTLNHLLAKDQLLGRIILYHREVADRKIAERALDIERRLDALATHEIRQAVAAGRLECDDPEALAVLIRVSFQGWWFVESHRDQHVSDERVTHMLLTLIQAKARKPERRK